MRLYNTLTRTAEELPESPAPIGIYTCGPTVYQRIHVGNARPFVLSMWLRRWLVERGYDVTLVENITDINDKIYDAAPGASEALARDAAEWYVEDTDLLGLGRPDVEPKATESIEEIVSLIVELVATDHAYAVDGDVYFRVSGWPEYGRLSGQKLDQLEEQEPNPLKKDPRDFALWKATKEGEDTSWDSPWGRGRPGWHIECSAMAEKYLGQRFEIHMGGLDLVFPHHENEIAQSRSVGREFARIWMHNGMLRFVGEKMSKSLGNVVTLREAVERWGKETLLLYFLTAHWSKPIDFSDETLEQAREQVESFRNALRGSGTTDAESEWDQFAEALDDDFNTPRALAILHRWRAEGKLPQLVQGLEIFGLGSLKSERTAPASVQALAIQRMKAREDGDFAEADRLRVEIASAGWEARDVADGFQLVPKR